MRQKTNLVLPLASRRVSHWTWVVAIAALLAPAAPASAADVSLGLAAPAGVRLGEQTAAKGKATEAGAALAGRTVRLEARPHPFTGAWRAVASARTAVDGSFAFTREFDRNNQLRVRLEGEPDELSEPREAFVLPAFRLSYTQRGKRLLRLRQTT